MWGARGVGGGGWGGGGAELRTYGSHFPSRGLAATSRCLFRTLPVYTGRSVDFKTGRPVSPEEQTRARSKWSSETFQGSQDLVWIKVKTTLVYIYVYIYFSEVQTCSKYTGGHSELKGVIVAQGSWQKEREKKNPEREKVVARHVRKKNTKAFLTRASPAEAQEISAPKSHNPAAVNG